MIERPASDLFHNRKSFVDCRDDLAPYLKKAGKTLSEKERMEIMLQIAGCEVVIGNITEAEILLKQCEAYIMAHGREEEKAMVYHVHCRLKIHYSDFAEALDYGLKAYYLFKQLPFPFFTMNTCTCCGLACGNLNLYTEGIDMLTEARTIALSMGDVRSAILCTANLSEIRLRIMSTADNIAHNKEMLQEVYAEYGDQPSMAESATCLHLALLYSKTKEFDMAQSYAERSMRVLRNFDYLPPYHFLYTNLYAIMAEIAGGMGDEKTMLKYAKESTDRGNAVNKKTPEIDVSFSLFRYYLEHQDMKKAKRYLDRAASLIPDKDRGAPYLDLNENLCLYYEAIGDSASELHHFKLIYEYKIKTQQEALDNRIKYLSNMHQLELNKKEMDQQKVELDFKTQELNMTTYHLQKRNELLTELKTNINELKKEKHKSDVVFKTITKMIDHAFNKEETEKVTFREKFDETQRSFIVKLHRIYPMLSPTECRVCALLRSGFNTKEICSLLSTTSRNIENHRLSIRKKMKLTRDENLNLKLASLE